MYNIHFTETKEKLNDEPLKNEVEILQALTRFFYHDFDPSEYGEGLEVGNLDEYLNKKFENNKQRINRFKENSYIEILKI